MDDCYKEAANYIVKRASFDEALINVFEDTCAGEMSMHDFAYKLSELADDYLLADSDDTIDLVGIYDELDYVVKEIRFAPADIVERLLWFNQCHMMGENRVSHIADCPGCGHDEMYERETESGDMYDIHLECIECGKKYELNEVIDFDEDLPRTVRREPGPLDGLNPNGLPVFTDEDKIYRFRVSRRIIELQGTDTLADLSYAIQSMYDLDVERLSSFYMGKKFFDRSREINCPRIIPFDDIEHSTAELYRICDMKLYEKQKFLYLHDFMREHRFNISFFGVRMKNT
ncbi:MAG: hypothetical protein LBD23_05395 [Oscillospiraceae bacterium]|jgi:DNA-directed RNA polymerase subunit M/transcription elongation factor TFIIS|nr:hypothetical protein [Oscillospiraceae bacterium]